MKKNNHIPWGNVIGVVSLILIAALWFCVRHAGSYQNKEIKQQQTDLTLQFDSDEWVYDGTEPLNLLEGVRASDQSGTDLTQEVSAVITADGTLQRKKVRYLLCGDNGSRTTCTRTLIMKDYHGPSLHVTNPLHLDQEDLDRLIDVMTEQGQLTADDGFGHDISSQVTCVRERIQDQQYTMRFQVINAFQDAADATVKAYITGDVKDPIIQLGQDSIVLAAGDQIDPLSFVAFADDGSGSCQMDDIQVETSLNTMNPGNYQVVYHLYNGDKTAKTTAVLQVTVQGM